MFPIGAPPYGWRHAAGVRTRSHEGLLGSSLDLLIDKSPFQDLQLGGLGRPNAAWKYQIKLLLTKTAVKMPLWVWINLPCLVFSAAEIYHIPVLLSILVGVACHY